MRKVIYTVVTGGYDTVNITPQKGFDMVVLTDDPDLKVKGFEVISFEPWRDPVKLSRHLKIMAHEYIDYDVYYYMDANYKITGDINSVRFKGGYLAFRHPVRKCIYQEAERINELHPQLKSEVNQQVGHYASQCYPRNNGLYANGFFIRDRSADELCEAWWEEVNAWTNRDQLSLPYVAEDFDCFQVTEPQNILKLLPHKPYKKKVPNVYYFVPARGDKSLGEWYNAHCELVPNDDDWICIRDQDTMFLHPYSSKLIEDAITRHGNEYNLFSCVTNRLGLEWQLPEGFDDGWTMQNNMDIANRRFDEYYSDVEESKKPTAGLFMLFQKKTWKKNKFHPGIICQDGQFIDWKFSSGVLKNGGKIGILKGLFIYHLYRMWKKKTNIDHLR